MIFLPTLDAAKSAVLVLLHLKVEFDTIDHSVLISRLEHWVGIQGNALNGLNPILTIEGSLLVLRNLLQMQLPLRVVSLKALF